MANIVDIDFEGGNLNEFDSTTDNLVTFEANTASKKTGSYGMSQIGAGSGSGIIATGSTEDTLYVGFHLYMGTGLSLSAWESIAFIQTVLGSWTRQIRFGITRNSGSSGAPTSWFFADTVDDNNFTTNLTLGEWHWVELELTVGSSTVSGGNIWIDGDSAYSGLDIDLSAESSFVNFSLGTLLGSLSTNEYIYFDNFIISDSGRVTEPTDGGNAPTADLQGPLVGIFGGPLMAGF